MKRIKLTQGKFALVDDEDFEKLSQYKWYVVFNHGNWYAKRNAYTNKKVVSIYMHRFIINTSPLQIDHKDRNGLNNQKCNLRFVTHSQNLWNSRISPRNTSGFKGVRWHTRDKIWHAAIRQYKKTIHLGVFITKEEAARAYDKKAKELFGDFACLNFNKD